MPYHNIVLIDDDEDDHEIFLDAVEQVNSSVQCTVFFEAAKALEKLSTKQVVPDAIFLDLNMPVMNGQQFLTEIKNNHELIDIPVIIYSTSSNSNMVLSIKKLGAHDFITKPDNFDDLIKILKPLLT